MYGRDKDIEFVFKWLTSNTHKNLSILSIMGMGGLGKTVLAQHVFNDPRIDFDIKVWVSVRLEFDVLNVSRAILDIVTGSTDHSIEQEVVQRRLKEELTGKKFLLILDDVGNERRSKWKDVQKPLLFGGQGSKIIVTTRSEKVSVTMRSEKHLLPVLREHQIKEKTNTAPTAVDSEKTAIVPFETKRLVPNRPSAYYTDLHQEQASNHQGSSSTWSCQRGDNALVLQSQKSSWPEILSTFDRMVQNQLKHEVEEIQKSKKELEDANLKVAQLEAKLSEMAQDRDDALAKLQRTIDEREAANWAWESTENMLQGKISTLNTALETVKDESGRCFVEGFNGALEQFHVLYPHLDTSTFDPFKSVDQ
ncbi:putative disease resistance protein RGA3 [Phaseolus vulgaris]|uniref:putative disease resistance protein RGA3 n=1 Tax=Phaseolus vulgaris TaxID=3885 RepID=UPI0035CABD6E